MTLVGLFGFVPVSFSSQTNVLNADLAGIQLLVVVLSMPIAPLFFIRWERISSRISGHRKNAIDRQSPVIMAGTGRFGQIVSRMLQLAGLEKTAIDHEPPHA